MLFDINDFDETLRGLGNGTSSVSPLASRSWAAKTGFRLLTGDRPTFDCPNRGSGSWREGTSEDGGRHTEFAALIPENAEAAALRSAGAVPHDDRDDRDPLFLQAKEAQASVLEAFVGRSRYP
jgi:hypothetical protein